MNSEPHDDTLNPAEEAEENAAMEEVAPVPAPPPVIDHFGEPWWELVNVPTQDNGEPLVDMFRVAPDLRWMHESLRFDFPRFGLIRESAAYMLRDAQQMLPRGLRLQIIGAFRLFATQKAMYEIVWKEFQAKHPTWPDDKITEYVNVFSAPPIWDTPPPHTTGGAVDLSLINEAGERLDMISPFEMGWDSAPTLVAGLSETARRNRQLLFDVLNASGLTNFPGEWWHWSYGEPGWALRGGHPYALYGAVPDDQIPDWEPPTP